MDFCLYCKTKIDTGIIMHLVVCHREEPEVAAALREPLGSKEREMKIEKIVNEGNFMHNTEVGNLCTI